MHMDMVWYISTINNERCITVAFNQIKYPQRVRARIHHSPLMNIESAVTFERAYTYMYNKKRQSKNAHNTHTQMIYLRKPYSHHYFKDARAHEFAKHKHHTPFGPVALICQSSRKCKIKISVVLCAYLLCVFVRAFSALFIGWLRS